ncbi:MAG TPA: hypothetical protein VN729_03205 [Ktedonobacteraceae bacterium]|nr:hypothetical protein [Ktedonobacteraceae bacterium]
MSDSHRGRLRAPQALAFFGKCGGKMREAHLSTTLTTLFVRRSRKNPQ